MLSRIMHSVIPGWHPGSFYNSLLVHMSFVSLVAYVAFNCKTMINNYYRYVEMYILSVICSTKQHCVFTDAFP